MITSYMLQCTMVKPDALASCSTLSSSRPLQISPGSLNICSLATLSLSHSTAKIEFVLQASSIYLD